MKPRDAATDPDLGLVEPFRCDWKVAASQLMDRGRRMFAVGRGFSPAPRVMMGWLLVSRRTTGV
jgi:hypothetical protein